MEPGPHTATRMVTYPPNIRMHQTSIRTDRKEGVVTTSTPKSPPNRRAMDVLDALAASSTGLPSAELARQCGISTSTCALVLGELERGGWVARYDDRRYGLGSGLFVLFRGLRNQFPLLEQ